MKMDKERSIHLSILRKRAEELINKKTEPFQSMPPEDIPRLIHELNIHQIELEMQNEELRQAQLEIEESHRRYFDLYDFAPVGYFTLNEKGLVVEVNLTGADMLGVERRSLIKKRFSAFIDSDFQGVFFQHRTQAIKVGAKQSCQLKLRAKDGTEFYAQMQIVPIKDNKGDIKQFRMTITDITENVNREAKLLASKENLDKAQEVAHLGNWEWDLENDQITWSDEMYRIYGIDPQTELKYDMLLKVVHPDDRDDHNKIVSDWIKDREGGEFEYRVTRSDGTIRFVCGMGKVFCDKDGKPVRMLGVVQDITERKQAEEELEKYRQHLEELVEERTDELKRTNEILRNEVTERKQVEEKVRKSEEKYRMLIETSNDAVFLVEEETGMIIETNKQAEVLLGRPQEEIIGMHYSQLHPPNEIVCCGKDFLNLIEEGGNVLLCTHAIHKDGHEIPVEITGNIICVKDKRIIQGIFRDISERKRAEEAIKAKQKKIEEINANLARRVKEEVKKSRQKDYILIKQSRMAAMGEMIRFITHQWGQPLWALQLLFHNIEDLIESSGTNTEDTDEFIANGFALVKRMVTTMNDFKSFFREEKKKVTFSINKSVKDALSLVGASLKYSNIPIRLNEKEELMVSGFPNEFSQVILNILKNAEDAIVGKGIDGEIKMDLLCEGDSAVIRIKDNGKGIPEEILNKIFDPYFTTKKEDKGSGIGLYLSKIIIEERMKGCIKVKNTKEGVEFEINLPLVQP